MIGVSFIFWIMASICSAVINTLTNNYRKSVFFRLTKLPIENDHYQCFWNPMVSCDYGKVVLGYKIDALNLFQFFKMFFIICTAIAFDKSIIEGFSSYILLLMIYGALWKVYFNVFCNNILRRNNE